MTVAFVFLGLLGVLGIGLWLLRRSSWRRARILSRPFPPAWRGVLESEVAFYRALSTAERDRFERELQIFLGEQTIQGPRGADVSDGIKVLIAASAIALVFGRAGYRYQRLRDIVVYPDAFDDEYRIADRDRGAARAGDFLGMVHAQGPILFSEKSLREGFQRSRDGLHVGYHEFAHVLDFEDGRADGVPSTLPWRLVEPWMNVVRSEIRKIQEHRSTLRDYGAENEAELFAVATEMFFERGSLLHRKHPRLYSLLVQAYGFDPEARSASSRSSSSGSSSSGSSSSGSSSSGSSSSGSDPAKADS